MEQAKLMPGITEEDTMLSALKKFGESVSNSGDTLLVSSGSTSRDAYMFVRNDTAL